MKRTVGLLSIIALAAVVAEAAQAVKAKPLDLARAPATASSVGWRLPATLAFDNDTRTRWASDPNEAKPAWIYVDLGGEYTIGRVDIDWELTDSIGGHVSPWEIRVCAVPTANSAAGTPGTDPGAVAAAVAEKAPPEMPELLQTRFGVDKLLFVKRKTLTANHYYTEFINSAWMPGGNLCVLDLKTGHVTDLVPELSGGVFNRFDLGFDADRRHESLLSSGRGDLLHFDALSVRHFV